MNLRMTAIAVLASVLVGSGVPHASAADSKLPASWDNLVEVKSKRLDGVYLLPGADFRQYTKVMIDPPEVAFQKNWLRDYNSSSRDLTRRLSQADAQKMLEKGSSGFEDIFTKAYTKAGYQVVTTRGEDVLRLRTAVLNVVVSAPDVMSPGRSYNFSADAGEATLVVEARDSMSGALLGRAIDRRLAGDNTRGLRTSISNSSDFRLLFDDWARISADGLGELKAMSPIGGAAAPAPAAAQTPTSAPAQ